MPFTVRRILVTLAAVTVIGAFTAEDVMAQGATVGPAGGIPSTTAPSNSQGTPSGGTGTLSTTRVGPATTTATTTRRHRTRRHHARRTARPAQTQTN